MGRGGGGALFDAGGGAGAVAGLGKYWNPEVSRLLEDSVAEFCWWWSEVRSGYDAEEVDVGGGLCRRDEGGGGRGRGCWCDDCWLTGVVV